MGFPKKIINSNSNNCRDILKWNSFYPFNLIQFLNFRKLERNKFKIGIRLHLLHLLQLPGCRDNSRGQGPNQCPLSCLNVASQGIDVDKT
jgi:hypothetical protein